MAAGDDRPWALVLPMDNHVHERVSARLLKSGAYRVTTNPAWAVHVVFVGASDWYNDNTVSRTCQSLRWREPHKRPFVVLVWDFLDLDVGKASLGKFRAYLGRTELVPSCMKADGISGYPPSIITDFDVYAPKNVRVPFDSRGDAPLWDFSFDIHATRQPHRITNRPPADSPRHASDEPAAIASASAPPPEAPAAAPAPLSPVPTSEASAAAAETSLPDNARRAIACICTAQRTMQDAHNARVFPPATECVDPIPPTQHITPRDVSPREIDNARKNVRDARARHGRTVDLYVRRRAELRQRMAQADKKMKTAIDAIDNYVEADSAVYAALYNTTVAAAEWARETTKLRVLLQAKRLDEEAVRNMRAERAAHEAQASEETSIACAREYVRTAIEEGGLTPVQALERCSLEDIDPMSLQVALMEKGHTVPEDAVPECAPACASASATTPALTDEAAIPTECTICMDAPPVMAFVPCGHRCICASCADGLKASVAPREPKCPFCRTEAFMIMKVFD